MSREKQDATQTKVFTRWCNMHLKKRGKSITNLIEDVKDGIILNQLLEILTEQKIKYNKKPKIRVHMVENCTKALDFVTSQQYVDHHGKTVNIKLTNISGRDIVDSKKTLILGLIYTMISRLQVSDAAEVASKEGVNKNVQEFGLKCTNLHKDWNTGRLFAALVSKFRPDNLNYSSLDLDNNEAVTSTAFEAAEKCGIERLLDVEDVLVSKPDEKSIFTQVLQYFLTFASGAQTDEAAAKVKGFVNVLMKFQQMSSEYESLVSAILAWIEKATEFLGGIATDGNLEEERTAWKTLGAWKSSEKLETNKKVRRAHQLYQDIQSFLRTNNRPDYVAPAGLDPTSLSNSWASLEQSGANTASAVLTAIRKAEDAMRKSFADAADAYYAWTESPTSKIAEISTSNAPSGDRLASAKAVQTLISTEGTPLFESSKSAQSTLDAASITENSFTAHSVESITMNWSTLGDSASSLVSRMAKAVANDDLRRAYAAAANDFVAWISTPQSSLAALLASSAVSSERAESATSLQSSIISEGTPLYDACAAANTAAVNAGIVSNAFTAHSHGAITQQWESLKNSSASAASRLTTLASHDALRKAFAAAADEFHSYLNTPAAALAKIVASSQTNAEKTAAIQDLSDTTESDGGDKFAVCESTSAAISDAGITKNSFTTHIQSDLAIAWNNIKSNIAGAKNRFATEASHDEVCKAFAVAASAFNTWIPGPTAELETINNSTDESASRAEAASALKSKVESEGTPLFDAAKSAQDAVDATGRASNAFTSADMGSISLSWGSLTTAVSNACDNLNTLAEHDALRKAFATAATEFVSYAGPTRDSLANINDATTGSNAERRDRANELKSSNSTTGGAKFSDCESSSSAVSDAGITENSFTTHSQADLTVTWTQLCGDIDATCSRLETAAQNDVKCRAFATAAEAVTSWCSAQRKALASASDTAAAASILSSYESDSNSLLEAASAAHSTVEEAGVDNNPFTSSTPNSLKLEVDILKGQVEKRKNQLEKEASDKALCVAFATSADKFVGWAKAANASLSSITGETDERLAKAVALKEKIETEGAPLVADCNTTSDAVSSAGIVENTETSHSIDDINLEYHSLTEQSANSVIGLEKALAEEKRIAETNREQVEEFTQVFASFDKDRSASLEIHEFSAAAKALGFTWSDEKTASEFKAIDTDRSGSISKSEFITFMVAKSQSVATESSINQAFGVLAGEGAEAIAVEKLGLTSSETVEYLQANCPQTEDGKLNFKAWTATIFGAGKEEAE